MAIVSISEAARLTGKSRNTLHAQIRTGKLSTVYNPVTDSKGIDTSELLRVFGSLKSTPSTVHHDVLCAHHITSVSTDGEKEQNNELKVEIELLKSKLDEKEKQLKDKQDHIESLKQAMRLLEDQRQKSPNTSTASQEEPEKEEKKSFFKRLFNN